MAKAQQKRTLETRAKLLDAARVLEAETGLDAITAEALARQAGVAKGTVFAHFGDMDGLLSHLLIERLEALHEALQAEPFPALTGGKDPADDPVGGLLGGMIAFVELISESDAMLRVYLANTGVTKPTCAEAFITTLQRLDGNVIAYLKAWQEHDWQPPVRTDRSMEDIIQALIAFMIYSAIHIKSYQVTDRAQIHARMRRHVEAYLLAR